MEVVQRELEWFIGTRDGAQGDHGSGCGVAQFGRGCGQCYAFPRQPEVENLFDVIEGILPIFHHTYFMLFDLGLYLSICLHILLLVLMLRVSHLPCLFMFLPLYVILSGGGCIIIYENPYGP